MQCSVESSKELLAALSTSVLEHLRQGDASKLSLLVLDSAGAFFPLDRVHKHLPSSPKGCADSVVGGVNVNAPAPFSGRTLSEVHKAVVSSLRTISRLPVVTFVTVNCSTQWDSSGRLQYRPYLPTVWEVWALSKHKDVLMHIFLYLFLALVLCLLRTC
jgi:hypothetical protein